MISKRIFVFVCLLAPVFAIAQKKKDTEPVKEPVATSSPVVANSPDAYQFQYNLYRSALNYGDLSVAKVAVFNMIALKPENTYLRDTLSAIYYNIGAYAECILSMKETLEKQPENMNMLELKAVCEQNLSMSKEALADYEKLYSKSKDVYHLYQIATLQYELKRVVECRMSIDQIIADPESEKKAINITVGNRGQQQKTPLKAAAYNLKGVLAMDISDLPASKGFLESALKIFPEFVLAKGNLDLLQSKMNPAKTGTGSKTTKPAPTKSK